jgi:hypothetical protein
MRCDASEATVRTIGRRIASAEERQSCQAQARDRIEAARLDMPRRA